MPKYYIRVTRNEEGKITSLYSPDLKEELLNERAQPLEVNFDYRSYLKTQISEYLSNSYVEPAKHRFLEPALSPTQHWEPIEITLVRDKKCFEKTLPTVGNVFNGYNILTNAFVTFMALRIASDNNNSSASNVMSIFGALFSLFIIFFVYYYSNASKVLADTGMSLDNYIANNRNTRSDTASGRTAFSCNVSPSRITLGVLAGGCMIGNSLIWGIKTYQEYILLTIKYLQLYPNMSPASEKFYYELIKWALVASLVTNIYCALSFQASFAKGLVNTFAGKESPPPPSPNSDNPENAMLLREVSSLEPPRL